jgi:hypothetical protein
MLTRSLDTNLGLTNFSCGTILDFYYCGKPEPIFILVEFEGYKGVGPVEGSRHFL